MAFNLKELIKKTFPPSFILRSLYLKHKLWGVPELKLLKKLIRPGSDAIDIGVYLGVFSYSMSRYARQVISFEPHPRHFDFSKKALPSNVEILNLALSDTAYVTELIVPVKYPSAGSLSKEFADEDVEKFKVEAKTLDSFGYKNISCMKIDAEGHEFNILKGARETILRNMPNLIIEIEQRHIEFNIQDVFDYILNLGYNGYFYQDKKILGLELFDVNKHQPNDKIGEYNDYINNFIFIPKQSPITF